MRTSHPRQAGLSLIELMVAVTIAAFLSLGLVQVFSAQRIAFAANEALARIQENSRFALNFIENDLRMAGNMSCLNELGFRGRIYNHLSPTTAEAAPWIYRIDQPLQVYEYAGTAPGATYALQEPRTAPGAAAWNPPLPPELGIGAVALDGSDVLVVRYMEPESTVLTGIGVNSVSGEVNVLDPTFVEANGIYGVNDCRNFSLFEALSGGSVVNAASGGRNLQDWSAFENAYGPDVPVHRFHFAAYYVAKGAEGGAALFRVRLNAAGSLESEEIVTGVETLQAVLGADSNLRRAGDAPTQYFTAAAVETGGAPWVPSTPAQRWSAVVNLRVGALIRGEGRAASPAPLVPLEVADTRIATPLDSRIRHVYEMQVALRNRIRG